MAAFQSMDGNKNDIMSIISQDQAETERGIRQIVKGKIEEASSNINKGLRMSNSKRARLLAKDDKGVLAVGSVGALMAGVGFPASGVSV